MKKYIWIAITAMALAGCNGGGGDDGTPTTPTSTTTSTGTTGTETTAPETSGDPTPVPVAVSCNPCIGSFVDAPVENLKYTTPSHPTPRKTGPGGTFEYIPGEEVSFAMGNRPLGTVPGYGVVNPLDLQADDPNRHEDYALNIMRVMISIDMDRDPSNGITLPDPIDETELNNFIATHGTSLFDMPTEEFAIHPRVWGFVVDNTPWYVAGGPSRIYPHNVTVEMVADHFATSMEEANSPYSLNLVNTVWTSELTWSHCPEASSTLVYEFYDTYYVMSGSDTINRDTCEVDYSDTGPWIENYGNFSAFALDGGPVLTHADLARINRDLQRDYENGVLIDEREEVTIVWHKPGSDTVISTSRVLGSNEYVKETITRLP